MIFSQWPRKYRRGNAADCPRILTMPRPQRHPSHTGRRLKPNIKLKSFEPVSAGNAPPYRNETQLARQVHGGLQQFGETMPPCLVKVRSIRGIPIRMSPALSVGQAIEISMTVHQNVARRRQVQGLPLPGFHLLEMGATAENAGSKPPRWAQSCPRRREIGPAFHATGLSGNHDSRGFFLVVESRPDHRVPAH